MLLGVAPLPFSFPPSATYAFYFINRLPRQNISVMSVREDLSGGSINLNFKPDEFSPELASSLYVGMHSQQNFKKTNSVLQLLQCKEKGHKQLFS